MSDTMLFGVLRMPYELAMSTELSRRQFHDRAQQACDALEAMQAAPTLTDEQIDALAVVLAHYGDDSRIAPLRALADRAIERAAIAAGAQK